ncbi:carbohydrate porin [Tsuneonella suprasediminis]|uniref:carbohydrate porin n=1 Tax=Tsuneonella suprasediminis TaxID=2306996 RepID=UPI002F92E12B
MLMSSLALAVASLEGDPRAASSGSAHPHDRSSEDEAPERDPSPLSAEVVYTSDVMANVAGGVRRGARYIDNVDMVIQGDFEQLAGWRGAQFQLYGLYNNGVSISDFVGDTHALSNIETGVRAVRLYEAWIDQKLSDSASLRVGLYDLNSEFDVLDASAFFIGSAHGIGTDFAQSGKNGPSIFPWTSLAARLEVRPTEGWAIRVAVLDGVPGDPDRPARTHIHLGGDDGALMIAEAEAPFGNGKLLFGHWRYTEEFDRLDGGGAERGNLGTYVRAERRLLDTHDYQIDAFARFGIANGRFNMFNRFVSGGINLSGWSLANESDQFGVAFAVGFTSRDYRAATGAGSAELAVEAGYRTQITPWLAIQPNLQYIHNPSADPTIPDALVLGIRTEIGVSLFGN